jgi:hypothetical protein
MLKTRCSVGLPTAMVLVVSACSLRAHAQHPESCKISVTSSGLRVSNTDAALYVEPEAFASSGERMLALGNPVLFRSGSRLTPARVGQGLAAGALFDPQGTASLVPVPPGVDSLLFPRAHYTKSSGWTVLWLESEGGRHSRARVRYGQFDGKAWSPAGTVPGLTASRRPFSTPTATAGGIAVAVGVPPGIPNVGISILASERGTWRVSPVPATEGAVYPTLVRVGRALVLAYVGYSGDDIALMARRSEDDGATWSPPVVIARGRGYEAQLAVLGTDVAIVWTAEVQQFEPRGAWIAYSSDSGKTWSPPVAPPRGDIATSVAVGNLSATRALLVEHSRAPRQHDFVLLEGRSQTLASRNDSVVAVVPPKLTSGLSGEVFALTSLGDLVDGELMPRSSLSRLALSCHRGS